MYLGWAKRARAQSVVGGVEPRAAPSLSVP